MKSYTDIEQSKKLAEILPLESADMFYHYNVGIKSYYEDVPRVIQVNNHFAFFHQDVPCWSLAALLSLIPKRIKDYNVLRIDISDNDFAIWYDEIGYGVNAELPDIETKEPIDACVEMILKLKEKNQA